jgi:gas vesicle protein
MDTRKTGSNYLWKGLWIGGFLGALGGFFLAPKSGRELRSDIKQKGVEAFDGAKRVYSETQRKGQAILGDSKRIFAYLKGKEKAPVITASAEEAVGYGSVY